MTKYTLDSLGQLQRVLILDVDAISSEGLLAQLKTISGVISVFEEDCLSDTHYTIIISPRADMEDIAVARRDITDICNAHIK